MSVTPTRPPLCGTCGRPRWVLETGSRVFCLFIDSQECLDFKAAHPGFVPDAPNVCPPDFPEEARPPEGVHLTDDEAKLALAAAQYNLNLLTALRDMHEMQTETRPSCSPRSDAFIDKMKRDNEIEAMESLVATLNARVSLLCPECGVGPGYWCKMSCDTHRYGPKAKGLTIPVRRE